MISIIAAMGKNRVIGKDGKIPWKLPGDFARFKKITSGHPVIMGRKTFESIGKPLPNRKNIVITRQKGFAAPGCEVAPSVEEGILRAASFPGAEEIFIIGGGEIYKQAMDVASRIYLTLIEEDFVGDAHFPEIDESKWKLTQRESGTLDAENIHRHSFLVFDRS